MPKGLLGKKIGMSTYFTKTGDALGVTYVELGPCKVLQLKNKEKDGYQAVQLGFGKKKEKHTSKPLIGHLKKANSEPVAFIKELPIEQGEELKIGQDITLDMFKEGDYVDVSGYSIGKGFQGGVKRYHWKGGKRSHGSMFHRAPGSIQSNPRLTKVTPGHHLPGHMGNVMVTVQNIEVVEVNKDKNILVLNGAVPGSDGNFVVIRKSIKNKKHKVKQVVQADGDKKKKPEKAAKPAKQEKKAK